MIGPDVLKRVIGSVGFEVTQSPDGCVQVSRYRWISGFGGVCAETGRDELFDMLAGGAEIALG